MLTRTIRFFTTREGAMQAGRKPREFERLMHALGASRWMFEAGPHWAEDDIKRLIARFGQGRGGEDGDFSLGTVDAAARIGISVKLFERMISRGLKHEIERHRKGKIWKYSVSSIDQYLAKRELVRSQKLWRSSDIAREYGISGQQALRWVREDSAHFPQPVVHLAGVDYWERGAVRNYKKGLDRYLAQPGAAVLAKKVGVTAAQVSSWILTDRLPAMESRLNAKRYDAETYQVALSMARDLAKKMVRRGPRATVKPSRTSRQ